MSARLKDSDMYCPECGTLIKKGFYICPNCKLKTQLSQHLKAEKKDTPSQSPPDIVEEVKKPLPVPDESIASKESPEEARDEKTNKIKEIKEEEIDNGQTPVEEESEDIGTGPESQDDPAEQDPVIKNIEERFEKKEKETQDK